jgi:hypothetical protein
MMTFCEKSRGVTLEEGKKCEQNDDIPSRRIFGVSRGARGSLSVMAWIRDAMEFRPARGRRTGKEIDRAAAP